MSVHEIVSAFQFLYAILSGDSILNGYAPGGPHRALAPPETPTPFTIFGLQSGTDIVTLNGYRVMVEGLFQIKCVGPASEMDAITNGAARIDALLGKPPVSGTTAGAYIASSYRETPLALDSIVNGEVWTDLGGLYRINIQ